MWYLSIIRGLPIFCYVVNSSLFVRSVDMMIRAYSTVIMFQNNPAERKRVLLILTSIQAILHSGCTRVCLSCSNLTLTALFPSGTLYVKLHPLMTLEIYLVLNAFFVKLIYILTVFNVKWPCTWSLNRTCACHRNSKYKSVDLIVYSTYSTYSKCSRSE